MRRTRAILVLTSALLAFGCVSPRRGNNTVSGGGGGTGGQLYVATPTAILRFSNVEGANGNVAPTATITSAALSAPQHLLADTANDRLYVANQGGSSVLVFDNASTLTPDPLYTAFYYSHPPASQRIDRLLRHA